MWGTVHNYQETVVEMWQQGGVRPFFHGIVPTLWRDCLWTTVFSSLRYHGTARCKEIEDASRRSSAEFVAVTFAGAVATSMSSPFNYVRNIVYATSHDAPTPSTWRCLEQLLRDARASGTPMLFLRRRLMIGWGTARVAVGMAVASHIYETTKAALSEP